MTTNQEYDIAVLGVGAVGSATAYYAAERGASVLGLEQFNIPTEKGSSEGYTRVVNPAMREHRQYVPLINHSLKLLKEVQKDHQKQIYYQTGTLRGWPGPNYTGHRDSLANAVEMCRLFDLDHTVLNSSEIQEKYPAYSTQSDYKFLELPSGGFLDPQEYIIAHVNRALSSGADIRANELVKGWESHSDHVRIWTDKDQYTSKKVIVTAGPWMPELIDEVDEIKSRREFMGWFKPEVPSKFKRDLFPAFGWDTRKGYFYGTPAHRINGIKVGGEISTGNSPETTPAEMKQSVSLEEEKVLRGFIEEYFPGGYDSTLRLTACMTTYTPDRQYVVGTHPTHSNVYIAGGFSGTGFMTASGIGEIITDMAIKGGTDFDIDLFQPKRLV